MLSETTRKWKKRVQELERDVRLADREKETLNNSFTRINAKVELYEKQEREKRMNDMVEMHEYKSQVEWLRELVEKIVVPPAMMKELTTRDLRIEELHAQERNRRKREQEQYLTAMQKRALEDKKTPEGGERA